MGTVTAEADEVLRRRPPSVPVVGVIGAGQLARMLHQAAVDLGVDVHVLADDLGDSAVAAGAARHVGRCTDPAELLRLAAVTDVLTFEHERVPADVVRHLEEAGLPVRPGSTALAMAQDKLRARTVMAGWQLPVPEVTGVISEVAEVAAAAERWGWPVVMKARTGGYDGRGVVVVDDLAAAETVLGAGGAAWFAEQHVELAAELSVLVARSATGELVSYPTVQTRQVDGMCREVVMPAAVPPDVDRRARDLATSITERIDAVGIVAVELFLSTAGELLVNELAVRPHNSGHATIEACATSQFENHLRAVLGLPLGSTEMVVPAAAMVNVVATGTVELAARLPDALAVPGARVHLYDKRPRPGRKVGHVTAVGSDPDRVLATARACAARLVG